MKRLARLARAALVSSGVVVCVAMYLFITAEVVGRGDGGTVIGEVTSVTQVRTGVQVCVNDPRSKRVYCGETSTAKAASFGFHVDQCVLIDLSRNAVLGVRNTDASPCPTA